MWGETMIDIEAIKADREAGTPGKWSDKGTKNGEWSVSHDDDCMWCFVGPKGKNPAAAIIMLSNVYRAGHRLDANARRISRLPDLEEAVIAAKEREDALLARVVELEVALIKKIVRVVGLEAALRFYDCSGACDECTEDKRDRVYCGWTARAALAKPGDAP